MDPTTFWARGVLWNAEWMLFFRLVAVNYVPWNHLLRLLGNLSWTHHYKQFCERHLAQPLKHWRTKNHSCCGITYTVKSPLQYSTLEGIWDSLENVKACSKKVFSRDGRGILLLKLKYHFVKILQAVTLHSKLYLSIRTEELSAKCTCVSAIKALILYNLIMSFN